MSCWYVLRTIHRFHYNMLFWTILSYLFYCHSLKLSHLFLLFYFCLSSTAPFLVLGFHADLSQPSNHCPTVDTLMSIVPGHVFIQNTTSWKAQVKENRSVTLEKGLYKPSVLAVTSFKSEVNTQKDKSK